MTTQIKYERWIETPATARLKMLEGLYDAPLSDKEHRSWKVDFPSDGEDWRIVLILGPSGAGKTTLLQEVHPDTFRPNLDGDMAVFDAIAPEMMASDVADALSAVGFNSIPSWRRPYRTLSNGEKFRADLAATLLHGRSTGVAIADEFTSVVDRQVAKIAAHAAQKYARRYDFRFIAASCHEDIVEWLQPDAVVRPDQGVCSWRSVQPRPRITLDIHRVHRDAWLTFAPHHYLTADLPRMAVSYVAFHEGQPVAYSAALFRPIKLPPQNLFAESRTVVLPDWQGVGIGLAMVDMIASAYKGLGYRYHSYPSHPHYRRVRAASKDWTLAPFRDGTDQS